MAVRERRDREDHESTEDLVRLYLNEIGRHPLLTKADEERLGRAIEEGREAAEELREAGSPGPSANGSGNGSSGSNGSRGRSAAATLTTARRRQLRAKVRAGEDATQEFIQANLRLVVSVAKRYQGSGVSLLDLVQEGNLGLIHAVEKFDYRKGFKFSTYATWWIRQAIARGIANSARTIRLPLYAGDTLAQVQRTQARLEMQLGRPPRIEEVAEELGMAPDKVVEVLGYAGEPRSIFEPLGDDGDAELGDVIEDASATSPAEQAVTALLGAEMSRLLSVLNEREQEILRLHYGLDRGEPRTLDEVGERLNLTRERIRQIEVRALSKLRHPSADRGGRELLAT